MSPNQWILRAAEPREWTGSTGPIVLNRPGGSVLLAESLLCQILTQTWRVGPMSPVNQPVSTYRFRVVRFIPKPCKAGFPRESRIGLSSEIFAVREEEPKDPSERETNGLFGDGVDGGEDLVSWESRSLLVCRSQSKQRRTCSLWLSIPRMGITSSAKISLVSFGPWCLLMIRLFIYFFLWEICDFCVFFFSTPNYI